METIINNVLGFFLMPRPPRPGADPENRVLYDKQPHCHHAGQK